MLAVFASKHRRCRLGTLKVLTYASSAWGDRLFVAVLFFSSSLMNAARACMLITFVPSRYPTAMAWLHPSFLTPLSRIAKVIGQSIFNFILDQSSIAVAFCGAKTIRMYSHLNHNLKWNLRETLGKHARHAVIETFILFLTLGFHRIVKKFLQCALVLLFIISIPLRGLEWNQSRLNQMFAFVLISWIGLLICVQSPVSSLPLEWLSPPLIFLHFHAVALNVNLFL